MTIENWDKQQIAKIKYAIKAGRSEMKSRGATALVFFDAFIATGGVQIPGMSSIKDETIISIGHHVKKHLIEGSGARYISGVEEWFFNAVVRELNRSMMEANWFNEAKSRDVAGFKLVFHHSSKSECCKQFAECDNYGLGAGIFPKRAIVVLPPCCDRSYFEVVFKDEISC